MKVLVLNGSPKGEQSVTFQYVRYVMQSFPEHGYDVLQLSLQDGAWVENPAAWEDAVTRLRRAELLVWACPVYNSGVPAQVMRFVERVGQAFGAQVLAGKTAVALLSSTHEFDQLAARYLHAVSEDLGMRFAGFYSAEMFDLLKLPYRRSLEIFMRGAFEAAGGTLPLPRAYAPLQGRLPFTYEPGPEGERVAFGNRRVLLLHDCAEAGSNVGPMLTRLASCCDGSVEQVNLDGLNIQGGCLGCSARCCANHTCPTYDDDFVPFYTERVMRADVLVFAGTIRGRFLSWQWKRFFDRTIFHGHVPTLASKPIAWVVSGPLRQIANLREYFEVVTEFQMANLVGIVTDEDGDAQAIDGLLVHLARRLAAEGTVDAVRPPTFLGIGGAKICSHIVKRNRFLFRADYPFFRRGRAYDLAPNTWRVRLLNRILLVLGRIPALRRAFEARFPAILIRPFQKLLKGG